VICGSWNKAIAEQTGIFNQVFSYDFFKKKSSDPSELDYHKLSAFLNELPSYDIAVDLRRYKDARFLITKVNAKLKVAVETGDPDIDAKIHVKVPTWPEYTYKANPLNERPIGDHMVSIIDAIPNLPTDFITFPDILKGRPAKKTRSIGIFPKAGERAREWGEKNYSQLIGLLCHDDHIDEVSVYLANDKEKKLLHLPTSPKVVVRAGLPLPKLIEALCENSLCVGNNSGGGHLASYLGIPTLAIYSGHESLDEWGPAYNEVYVLHRTPYCSPCHVGENCTNGFFCLQDITPGDAHASIRSILGFDDELKTGKERRRKYLYAKSKDRIVRTLFRQIITKTKDYNPSKLASLASIISNNHPGFPSSQDTVFAASNLSMNHLSPLLEFEGFYMPEIEFRWSEGNQSHIRFYRREKSSFNRVKIDFAHILAGIQEVKVKFNGREVLNSIVDDSCKFLKFCVDEMLAGVNNITLDLPTARVPDNGDSRKLAVAFKSMEISEQSTLRVGKIEDYRSEVIDFHGFHEPEDGFRWTSGREAKIQFLSEKSLEKCTIKIGVFHVIDDRQTINVSFNENALGEFVLNKQMKTFELAGIEIKKGKNTVSLSLPQAREASTDDRRIIAIALSDIRLLYTN
jgi:ADP-heptose:LPS heptosyltransferase